MARWWRWLRWLLPLAFVHVAATGAALVPLLALPCGDAFWAPAGVAGVALAAMLAHCAGTLALTAVLVAAARGLLGALRWCSRRMAAAGNVPAIAKRPLPGHDGVAPPCNSCGHSTSG